MTSLLRLLTGLSLIGGALAVGACGDDDSDGGSSTGGATTTGGKAASGGAPSSGGVAPSGGKGGSMGGSTPTGGSAPTGGKAASGGSGGDAGGSDSGEGGDAGSDTGGFAGVPSEPQGAPLLERPVEDGYDCELSQPLTLFDLDWNGGDVAGGAAPWLFWSAPDTEAVVGAALNGGALGTPHTVHDPAADGYA